MKTLVAGTFPLAIALRRLGFARKRPEADQPATPDTIIAANRRLSLERIVRAGAPGATADALRRRQSCAAGDRRRRGKLDFGAGGGPAASGVSRSCTGRKAPFNTHSLIGEARMIVPPAGQGAREA